MLIKINNYILDKQQTAIVTDENNYTLVTAGAGSGKTLTILGKLYYLTTIKNIKPEEIICISFTNASSISLKNKIKEELKLNIPVYTFHKLALTILKNKNYEIADSNLLEDIITIFFNENIIKDEILLKRILKYFKIKPTKNTKQTYQQFINKNPKELIILKNLISTFIHHLKCNDYTLIDFNKFLKQTKKTLNYKKYQTEKIFLILTVNIYLLYQQYLKTNNEIDFDDMIIKATKTIEKTKINKSLKYIIIDEYQDTSYIRFNLIKSILNKTNAKLLAVGDDFQSIYRFTGCDLSLFLDFKNYFKNAKIMKIENTYRNSQELISIAGNFIMKNKKQIKKNLTSTKHLKNPIQIIYYNNIKEAFLNLVLRIYQKSHKPILILGRNNNDIKNVLNNDFKLKADGKIIYLKNKNINLYYLTVHKSKGLEEENVIIINLKNNLLGFPNKIKNESILRFVTKNIEKYPYSEERRLFYVALTRTKNYVYLLCPKKDESIFIQEIKKELKISSIYQ